MAATGLEPLVRASRASAFGTRRVGIVVLRSNTTIHCPMEGLLAPFSPANVEKDLQSLWLCLGTCFLPRSREEVVRFS